LRFWIVWYPPNLWWEPKWTRRGTSAPQTVAGIVAQRIDDHARPELAAVLSHPPAFVLEFSFIKGRSQRKGRATGNLFTLRVKNGEVLADDLDGSVSLEALRPGVPGLDEIPDRA
jgi:hypothetical protein